MTDPIGATDVTEFRRNVLSTWARIANEQNWNGQFNAEMRNLGFSQEELDAARNAGKTVHTITITIRTSQELNGGMNVEDRVAGEVRRGFNLHGNDSVEVVHTTA